MAAPQAAAAADRYWQAQEEADQAQQALLDHLDEYAQEQTVEEQRALRKLRRKIKRCNPLPAATPLATGPVARYQAALAGAQQAWRQFLATFEADTQRVSREIQQIVAQERLCRAILWQNRSALHLAIHPLRRLDGPINRNSKQRQREELAARYLQRYCVKNDSIGFFGPVGWADLHEERSGVRVASGQNLTVDCQVYFEGWAIDALAEALTERPELQTWAAPRRLAYTHVSGATVRTPAGRYPLTEPQSLLLSRCTGQQTAHEIADSLVGSHPTAFRSPTQVYAALAELRDKGLIAWQFETPTEEYPERTLQRQLERIGDPVQRRQALSLLALLNAKREAVAQAANDLAALDGAMQELEGAFVELTGARSSRLHGRFYAGRTLVYQDCRRDVQVDVGSDVVEAIGDSLHLMLTGGRWLIHQITQHYRSVFRSLYRQLVQEQGSSAIWFVDFWNRAQQALFTQIPHDPSGGVERALQEFQARWRDILQLDTGQHCVTYRSQALRDRVEAAFPAPHGGWLAACYHSPDVMIAAASVEAIRQGDYLFVLGELHPGMNTLRLACFTQQNPQPQALFEAIERDIVQPRVTIIEDKEWDEFCARVRVVLFSPQDWRLSVSADPAETARNLLPIGDLYIEEVAGQLQVSDASGQQAFDVVEVYADTLTAVVGNCFSLLPPLPHTPRLVIDRTVICREAWRFDAAEIAFAFEQDEGRRFSEARRWRRRRRMPRFMFFRAPIEWKPIYLDFDSPIYVDIFAKVVRQTAEAGADQPITLTEMLPNHEQLWLTDAQGRRYTSELRIVAVDPRRAGQDNG